MTIGEKLSALVSDVTKVIGVSDAAFTVEPTELQHGDFATNAALVLAKALKKSPREVAETIVGKLKDTKSELIGEVSIAGPGFVNIRLSERALRDARPASSEAAGRNDSLKGQKYIVEYTDPNPFKEFHIGHLMSNTIGESISRLIEASGAETKRACYQGDVGMHVACALWGKRNDPSLTWAKAYALGASTYKNGTEEEKKEIVALNTAIYRRTDTSVNVLYDNGKKDSLEYFGGIYNKLGTQFNHYFFESETGTFGKTIVEKHSDIFEKSDGAVVYKGDESKGLHTRVFINKEGLPTYEAKELGLAKIKYDAYHYDRSIVITANEVNDYFRVILDAMGKVFPDLAAKTEHIGHGVMRLPTGKMSSRTGDVVTAESMIASVKEKVLLKMKESDVKDKDTVAEAVAIAAIKYTILRQAPGKDIIFDLEQATSFEGDSGPYLQYTFARTHQLLAKGADKGMKPDTAKIEEGNLTRSIARFSDIVLRAQKERAPQYVATYLIELAQEFNSYYGANLIVDEMNPEISTGRLALVEAVGRTLKGGLWMLGIFKVPEMM